MLFDQFQRTSNEPDAIIIDPLLRVEAGADGVCVVDGLYPLPLAASSRFFPRAASIPVLDVGGTSLGELLTCAGEVFDLPQFSAGYLAAYLLEVDPLLYGQAGSFSRDYLLVHQERLDEYKIDYLDGSAVWGGIQHNYTGTLNPGTTSNAAIRATKGITLPTTFHVETARRSVMQPFAFERFLKLYHLLELSFDHSVVLRIQALGADLKGIGQIISSLESNELHRLKQILLTCRNPANVTECIKTITADVRWRSHIQDIFFDFGKSGNPVAANREQDFFAAIDTGDGYTLREMQSIAGLPRAAPLQPAAFDAFSLNLASYWIYRVRSSIAHNRIGEYLMRDDDEGFVAFFAEPLLRCVLSEVL